MKNDLRDDAETVKRNILVPREDGQKVRRPEGKTDELRWSHARVFAQVADEIVAPYLENSGKAPRSVLLRA